MVSIVSDSYDIFNACSNIFGNTLKDEVINHNGMVVIRPDSGNPIQTPVKCIELLDEAFGHTVNSKGYKVLNNIRVIQGDGIDIDDINNILSLLEEKGYSIDNITFGMGGGLLQKVNRDTLKFAIKCSAIRINGEWKEVYKDPVDQPDKKSKKGLLLLSKQGNKFETIECENVLQYNEMEQLHGDLLRVVFENGKIIREQTLEEIRGLANV